MKTKKRRLTSVKLAVIGTGGMASHHTHHFKAIPGSDVDPKRASYFSAEHGVVSYFTDTTEMLKKVEIDAVTIVTPEQSPLPAFQELHLSLTTAAPGASVTLSGTFSAGNNALTSPVVPYSVKDAKGQTIDGLAEPTSLTLPNLAPM